MGLVSIGGIVCTLSLSTRTYEAFLVMAVELQPGPKYFHPEGHLIGTRPCSWDYRDYCIRDFHH